MLMLLNHVPLCLTSYEEHTYLPLKVLTKVRVDYCDNGC